MLLVLIGVLLLLANRDLYSGAVVQDFYWRDYAHGDVPLDAIQGAPGRYIGQVNYQGHFLPATIIPQINVALAEFGGTRRIEKNIKILCSMYPRRFYWELVNFDLPNDQQMKNDVVGGYQENINSTLFIGRVVNEGEYKIGKVAVIAHPRKGIFVWVNEGRNFVSLEFEILKYNSSVVGSDGCNFIQ